MTRLRMNWKSYLERFGEDQLWSRELWWMMRIGKDKAGVRVWGACSNSEHSSDLRGDTPQTQGKAGPRKRGAEQFG